MKTFARSWSCLSYLFLCLAGLALQSCRTASVGAASPETPFVVSFDFQEPIQASTAEVSRFTEALRYAVPEKSKILVGDEQVWPPKNATLTTVRATNGNVASGDEANVTRTRGTGALAATERVVHTQDGLGRAFVARARSTQYIAFKSKADMVNFARVLGGARKK